MRRLALVAASTLIAVAFLPGATWGAPSPTTLLVGYAQGDEQAAHLAIAASGGTVKRSSAELSFAVVETDDPDRFRALAAMSPHVDYVEENSAMRLDGAQWNGAQWNGAQWNGAQWNGAQWNGAQWNTMRDQGAQWNGAQWNAAKLTMRFHDAQNGKNWQYELATTDPGLVWQWGSWAVRAPDAWETAQGTRAARLCVLDSGVAWDHPDISPNVWTGPLGEHGWNAIDPTASPYDDAGHGTHVAGIAAGAVGNAYGIAGVANSEIMAVKILTSEGTGVESDLAFGLVWCANRGADVVLMALSVTEEGPTLDRAFQYASDRDALMLASAGNDGPCANCVAYPARDPRVMGVAALDGALQPASFSSQGPEVDLGAPGVDVLGPLPGGAFAFGSGTSQAVAFAAGLAGLIRDAQPTLSAAQVADILRATAVDVSEIGNDEGTGHGLLNADQGLDAALGA